MPTGRINTNSPLHRKARREGSAVAIEPKRATRARARRNLSAAEQAILRDLLEREQDFIDSEEFYKPDAEQRIYVDVPDVRKPDASWYHPVMDDLGSTRLRTPKSSEQVILTAAEERILFLQFNYARHRIREIQKLVAERPDRKPTHEQAEEMLSWYKLSRQLREQIAETNLALVLAMAKRTRMSEVDFADLVSEGNMALLRAIDKFDCGRGFKFSTYACRAILKAFSRQGMKLSKYRQRFPTDFDPALEKSDFLETKREEQVSDAASEVKRIVIENQCELSDIERTVIEHRFRLLEPETDEKPMTLEQVGQIIGVTKERVRQIQNKALEKIRTELEASYLGTRAEQDEHRAARLADGPFADRSLAGVN
ncbi:MAG: sigma-70 family RNA polymerase sigma factor [Planctomycetota bacterium]